MNVVNQHQRITIMCITGMASVLVCFQKPQKVLRDTFKDD